MVTRESVIASVCSQLLLFPEIETCVLYGSANQDRLTPQSDIDLAVASSEGLSKDTCLDFSLQVAAELDREVSVIDMEKMFGLILQEVLVKGHTILCKRPSTKAKYISRMLEYSEDILPYQTLGLKKKAEVFIRDRSGDSEKN
jgi:predicted nucleotidyltransferase